jgi:hypothetical protein
VKSLPIRVTKSSKLPANLEYCWLYDHDTRRQALCSCGRTREALGREDGNYYDVQPSIPYAADLQRKDGWWPLDGSVNVSIVLLTAPELRVFDGD